MLRETSVSQVPSDYARKRFTDDSLDLIVWYEADGSIHGFQLCYDPRGNPRALTWTPRRGFSHSAIDLGEDNVDFNRSPLLQPSQDYNPTGLRNAFRAAANDLPESVEAFVTSKLDGLRPKGPPVARPEEGP